MPERSNPPKKEPIELVVVDDEPLTLQGVKEALPAHYHPSLFTQPERAEEHLRKSRCRLVLLDLHFPDRDGMALLRRWRNQFEGLEVVIFSGEKDVERAVACLRYGAADYIAKPAKPETLRLILDRVAETQNLRHRVERLEGALHPHPVRFVVESPALRRIYEDVEKLKGETQLNILILGESGTGKEILARTLHQQEPSSRPFVVANMPAIPSALLEAELFGVEKGAFTDAKQARAGKFEQADGGDIFLDEIGDLPWDMQAKLLRTLQEKCIERVGSTRSRKLEFRTISATNQPLDAHIRSGRFREDLAYRLNDLVFWLPPLRERPEDIIPLARHFLDKHAGHDADVHLSAEAERRLRSYDWPGNIRQLESAIKRSLVFRRGSRLEEIVLSDLQTPASTLDASHASQMAEFEKRLFQECLHRHGGNRTAAREELRLPKATFYRKLAELELPA